MNKHTLADKLRQRKNTGVDDSPHLIIEARAGTGKTTTLIEGLRVIRGESVKIVPNDQQAAIWKEMLRSKGEAQTICFVAFNKSIATELQQRVPQGCDAMTMHSMGFHAIRRVFDGVQVSTDRVQDIIAEMLGKDIWELRRNRPTLLKATKQLVSLCKMNLRGGSGTDWAFVLQELTSHYDVDLNGENREIFALVPRVLERCENVDRDKTIDFDDMIWLPIVLNLNVYKYNLLLVDEAQDLNRCQQALALKAGRRLILCGDPKQAIYGFAGADAESMERMEEVLLGNTYTEHSSPHCHNWDCIGVDGDTDEYCTECGLPKPESLDRGCVVLPLTVTRRCGRAIVKEAQKIVPDFEAHESCGRGFVGRMPFIDSDAEGGTANTPSYRGAVAGGDMILCRVNAPLVSECFYFLKTGRKANIQGRDVGQGLISTIKRIMKPPSTQRDCIAEGRRNKEMCILFGRLSDWLGNQQRKEHAKRNPSDARLIALQDRADCIYCFAEGAQTVEEVVQKIEAVFTDDKHGRGIMLSSIHKAKGLEAERVFLLEPEGATVPHPLARSGWQREQELNLRYVAITRAKSELVFVS